MISIQFCEKQELFLCNTVVVLLIRFYVVCKSKHPINLKQRTNMDKFCLLISFSRRDEHRIYGKCLEATLVAQLDKDSKLSHSIYSTKLICTF